MDNEKLNEIMMRADANLDALKDRCHELYAENEMLKVKKGEIINYAIEKLYQLKVQAEFEDRQRGKKRYVSKTSAYNDLIKLLEGIYEKN